MKYRTIKFLHLFSLALCLFVSINSQTKDDVRPVVDDSKDTPEKILNPKLPTLFIVGDSTLKSNAPLRGWGQELGQFFNQNKLNVVNRAIGGRSSRTFQNEGRWDKVLAELKKGDFVIVQFGHNDVGKYDDPAAKERPSLHGEGAETAEVTKKDGTKETVHTFGWYMRKYGSDAKAKGATVIFCSMVPHKDWQDGKIIRKESETFVKWTENAAKANGATYINLNESVALEFEKLGEAKVEPLFGDKRTHSTPAGALLNAEKVVAALRALKNPNLKKYFSEKGKNIAPTPNFVVNAAKK
ncbi:MAG: rhamnogalacturonan acetylesterase [Acidobacteriota bacterium]|nr:rhamnogalacturonan acetylesterase [Acidobacteriota bacterium]